MNTTANSRPRLHTLQEAAAILKLCTRTVRRMIEREELKALRIGRAIRIKDEDLELYLLRASK
jgi:excisionase family DNA binding protein